MPHHHLPNMEPPPWHKSWLRHISKPGTQHSAQAHCSSPRQSSERSPLVDARLTRRPSAVPPLVSVSQESGSSADHSGETVLEVDFAYPGTRKVSMTEPTRRLSTNNLSRDRSPSPFRFGRSGSRSPYRSRDVEEEEKQLMIGKRRMWNDVEEEEKMIGKRRMWNDVEEEEKQLMIGKRRSSGATSTQQQQRTSTRKREQWARSGRAKTISARSSLFSVDSEPYPVHPLLRSTRSTSPRPSISGSSSRSLLTCF